MEEQRVVGNNQCHISASGLPEDRRRQVQSNQGALYRSAGITYLEARIVVGGSQARIRPPLQCSRDVTDSGITQDSLGLKAQLASFAFVHSAISHEGRGQLG